MRVKKTRKMARQAKDEEAVQDVHDTLVDCLEDGGLTIFKTCNNRTNLGKVPVLVLAELVYAKLLKKY